MAPDRLAHRHPRHNITMSARPLDDLNERLNAFLRSTPAADVQKNLKAVLTQSFARLDLVTREEFDIQAQVLARTREKLAALEIRVAGLEQGSSGPQPPLVPPL